VAWRVNSGPSKAKTESKTPRDFSRESPSLSSRPIPYAGTCGLRRRLPRASEAATRNGRSRPIEKGFSGPPLGVPVSRPCACRHPANSGSPKLSWLRQMGGAYGQRVHFSCLFPPFRLFLLFRVTFGAHLDQVENLHRISPNTTPHGPGRRLLTLIELALFQTALMKGRVSNFTSQVCLLSCPCCGRVLPDPTVRPLVSVSDAPFPAPACEMIYGVSRPLS
jgi:hypothetical protein